MASCWVDWMQLFPQKGDCASVPTMPHMTFLSWCIHPSNEEFWWPPMIVLLLNCGRGMFTLIDGPAKSEPLYDLPIWKFNKHLFHNLQVPSCAQRNFCTKTIGHPKASRLQIRVNHSLLIFGQSQHCPVITCHHGDMWGWLPFSCDDWLFINPLTHFAGVNHGWAFTIFCTDLIRTTCQKGSRNIVIRLRLWLQLEGWFCL